jgi:four helix bundle protein
MGVGKVAVMSKINSYRDLVVWQSGIKLAKAIYQATGSFPREEQYGLTSQLRRAAVSIPSNIAEGHNRGFTKEYIHFLAVALGSLAEIETQVILSRELNHLDEGTSVRILTECESLGRRLRSLSRSMRGKVS